MTAKKGKTWGIELEVIGLRFRFKKDARRALADLIEKRGSITGMRLIREPDNEYDENAIMVCLPKRMMDGKQIGYLHREAAELLAPKLDAGTLAVASAKLELLDPATDYNTGPMQIRFRDVTKKTPRTGSTKRKTRA